MYYLKNGCIHDQDLVSISSQLFILKRSCATTLFTEIAYTDVFLILVSRPFSSSNELCDKQLVG